MPYFNNFILTTDFATLKNDAITNSLTTSVTFPASVSVGGNSYSQFSSTIDIPENVNVIRAQIQSSLNSGISQPTDQVIDVRNGTVSGSSGFFYNDIAYYTTSNNQITCNVLCINPYSSTLITASSPVTYTFNFQIFLPPFAT